MKYNPLATSVIRSKSVVSLSYWWEEKSVAGTVLLNFFRCTFPHIYSCVCLCWTNRRLFIFLPRNHLPAQKFLWHWPGSAPGAHQCGGHVRNIFPLFSLEFHLFLRCAALPGRKPPRGCRTGGVTLAHSHQRCVYVMSKLSMANLHHVANTFFATAQTTSVCFLLLSR